MPTLLLLWKKRKNGEKLLNCGNDYSKAVIAEEMGTKKQLHEELLLFIMLWIGISSSWPSLLKSVQ